MIDGIDFVVVVDRYSTGKRSQCVYSRLLCFIHYIRFIFYSELFIGVVIDNFNQQKRKVSIEVSHRIIPRKCFLSLLVRQWRFN